ncbi:MAG: hypothetical protein V9G17_00340, partial [Nitrospira sp.]
GLLHVVLCKPRTLPISGRMRSGRWRKNYARSVGALVAYLVVRPDAAKGEAWSDTNGMYSHLLIDVETHPVVRRLVSNKLSDRYNCLGSAA